MNEAIWIRTAGKRKSFWRCGRQWTGKEQLALASDFSDEEWQRLQAEKALAWRPAEALDLDSTTPKEPVDPAAWALERLVAVIPALPADAFTEKGTPKLDALRAAVKGEADVLEALNAELRDQAMEKLTEGGFVPPKDTTGA